MSTTERITVLLAHLTAHPDDMVNRLALAESYLEAGQTTNAIETLDALCAEGSDPLVTASAFCRLAELQREGGERERAIEAFGAALDVLFGRFSAFDRQLELLREQGDWDAIEGQYRKMIQRSKTLTYGLTERLREAHREAEQDESIGDSINSPGRVILDPELAEKAIPQTIIVGDLAPTPVGEASALAVAAPLAYETTSPALTPLDDEFEVDFDDDEDDERDEELTIRSQLSEIIAGFDSVSQGDGSERPLELGESSKPVREPPSVPVLPPPVPQLEKPPRPISEATSQMPAMVVPDDDDGDAGEFSEIPTDVALMTGEMARLDAIAEALDQARDPATEFALVLDLANLYLGSGDTQGAESALMRALSLGQDDKRVLEQMLSLYQQTSDPAGAMDCLNRLFNLERGSEALANRYVQMARLHEMEQDHEQAVHFYNLALDGDHGLYRAFEAIEKGLEGRSDWEALELNYRRMINRVINEPEHEPLLFVLLKRMGALYRDKFSDPRKAVGAYETCLRLKPDDEESGHSLASLYLEISKSEPSFRRKAAAIYRDRIGGTGDRVAGWRGLYQLYLNGGMDDRAWCVAGLLVAEGAATNLEDAHYQAHRSAALPNTSAPLSKAIWRQHVAVPGMDHRLDELLIALRPVIYDILDMNSLDPMWDPPAPLHPVSSQLTAVSRLLDLPEPTVAVDRHSAGVRVYGHPASLVIGPDVFEEPDRGKVAFTVAYHAAHLLPEFRLLTQGLDFVEDCLHAVLGMLGPDRGQWSNEMRVITIREHVRQVAPPIRAQLEQVAAPLLADEAMPDLSIWQAHVETTCCRFAHLMANNFATSRSMVAGLPLPHAIHAEQIIEELTHYAISESYFALRELLGVGQ